MTASFQSAASATLLPRGMPWTIVVNWNDVVMSEAFGLNKKMLRFLVAADVAGHQVILTTSAPILRTKPEAIDTLRSMLDVSQDILGIRVPQFRIEFKDAIRDVLARQGQHSVGLLITSAADIRAGRIDFVEASLLGQVDSDGLFPDLDTFLGILNVRGTYQALERRAPRTDGMKHGMR